MNLSPSLSLVKGEHENRRTFCLCTKSKLWDRVDILCVVHSGSGHPEQSCAPCQTEIFVSWTWHVGAHIGWWYVCIFYFNLKLSNTVFRIHDTLFHTPFSLFPFELPLLPTYWWEGEKMCLSRLQKIMAGHTQKLHLALQLLHNRTKESVVH